MILRSNGLREEALEHLGVPVIRCGAVLTPRDEGEQETVARIAEAAARNGVEAGVRADGALEVPGECVTDPVAYTGALAAAAAGGGAEVRTGARGPGDRAAGTGLRLELGGRDR